LKLLIAYFLQNKTTAVAQAELETLEIHNAGLTIWGIICDGVYTNISVKKILSFIIGDSYSEIKSWFPRPITNDKVYLYLMHAII